jgi:hypothetical protein
MNSFWKNLVVEKKKISVKKIKTEMQKSQEGGLESVSSDKLDSF